MNHNYLNLEEETDAHVLVIEHENYNLDGRDNLDEIPDKKGVYAICGRVNGKPVNARWVGQADNLQEAVKNHYSDNETNASLRDYMRSIKTKALIYKCMPKAALNELEEAQEGWKAQFNPECTPELNKVF